MSCQINFENQETFILTALVKDNGTPPTSAQFEFIVTVLDVNEPPRSIELHGRYKSNRINPLWHYTILDWSKLKAFSDNNVRI